MVRVHAKCPVGFPVEDLLWEMGTPQKSGLPLVSK